MVFRAVGSAAMFRNTSYSRPISGNYLEKPMTDFMRAWRVFGRLLGTSCRVIAIRLGEVAIGGLVLYRQLIVGEIFFMSFFKSRIWPWLNRGRFHRCGAVLDGHPQSVVEINIYYFVYIYDSF